MKIPPPTNPIHIARAYGLGSNQRAGASQKSPSATEANAAEPRSGVEKTGRLVAGVVPGGIDFSQAEPRPKGPAIPLYVRPADRNDAATALRAGRMIDVSG